MMLVKGKASQKLRDKIKFFEGWRLVPYLCPAGKWTIGAGHRLYPKDKVPGLMYILNHWVGVISQTTAELLLTSDIAIGEKYVNELVKVPLNQDQFDALVDFAMNVGHDAFAHSTLLKYLNEKLYGSAARQFPLWVHDDHKNVLQGLVLRNQWRKEMFRMKVS